MKTADHLWTDPSADELVQRHRIHGIHCRQDSPTKRPALCVSHKPAQRRAYEERVRSRTGIIMLWELGFARLSLLSLMILLIIGLRSGFSHPISQIQKRNSSSSMDERPSPSLSAREYVESLHQNSRVTLLFGKNNVLVQPVTVGPLSNTRASRRGAESSG